MFLTVLPKVVVLGVVLAGVDGWPACSPHVRKLPTKLLRSLVFAFSLLGIVASGQRVFWLYALAWTAATLLAFLCVRRMGRNGLAWTIIAVIAPYLLARVLGPLFVRLPHAFLYSWPTIAYLVPMIAALLPDGRVGPVPLNRTVPSAVVRNSPAPIQQTSHTRPSVSDMQKKIAAIIAQRGLRPLGNRKRLASVEGQACNDYRAQFRDRASAELYFETFVGYAGRNPPPFVIEVMAAFTPNTIYSEKYCFILPYFNVGVREDYQQWARNAILACNDVQKQHSYCSGNSYEYVPRSIGANGAVFKWTILLPAGFDPDSAEGKELLSDPPELGYNVVNVEGQSQAVPDKPNPGGPWIGVLFDISQFSEALYGRAATKQLFAIVGEMALAGCVLHGGDLLPECRYWCNAIHAATPKQAEEIEAAIANSRNGKLAQDRSPILRGSQVPISSLPFQGFVSGNGVYVGS
jgi:hypothetical protein